MSRDRAGGWLLACAWLALAVAACKHDYDALREEYTPEIRAGQGGSGAGGGGSGGTGGSGGNGGSGASGGSGGSGASGGSGSGGTGGSGGSDGDSGTPADACEPCAEPSDAATELGLVSCCRTEDACGLAVEEGQACFPLDAPGVADAACPPIGPMGARREGCCRVDGRCGARFHGLGLGCVAREDIPAAIAPEADALPCRVPCEQDVDCEGLTDVQTVCVPDRERPEDRYCAQRCQRDGACAEGLVCALSPDLERDRLAAFCQPPYGDREPNEVCTVANQCIHGACLQLDGEAEGNCSLFCESDADCPAERPFCVQSSIARPSGDGTPIDFNVCSSRND